MLKLVLINHNRLILILGDKMFKGHLISYLEEQQVLYLFIDYNYEFANLTHQNKGEKHKTFYQKAFDYIKEKKIDFKGTKIFLVVNGLIIGSLIFGYHPYQDLKAEIEPKFQYVEYIRDLMLPKITEKQEEIIEILELNDIKEEVIKAEVKKSNPTTSKPKTESRVYEEPKTDEKSPSETIIDNEIRVTLYRYYGAIEEIKLEDYIIGVVGAEMPASFHVEALKAQAVAARTYALKRINEKQVLSDSNNHQIYKDVNQLKAIWGNSFNNYYNKIKDATLATKDEYIIYQNYYIDAIYHSTSNGKTEEAVAVWGNSFPYLVSVDSWWDLNASSYFREDIKDLNTVNQLLNLNLNEDSNIEVISRTTSNRINTISLDNTIFTGKQLRETLGLRSTDFDIRIEGNNIIFTTRGYGHGVGMSQYGANGMANQGYNYKQILAHYYPETIIIK